jgi:hypothetical protein
MSANYDKIEYATYLLKHEQKQNRGEKSRDSERLKTYRAEWMFQRQVDDIKFADIKEAQKFAKRVYKSKKWGKLWKESCEKNMTRLFAGTPRVVAMQRRSKTMSGCTDGMTVSLCPTSGLDKYTLLHELTHCLGHMHHGRSFRQTLLEMVGAFMGSAEKKILKNEFKRKGLACGNARKALSYHKWIESRDRMARLREKTALAKEQAERRAYDSIIQPCE